MNIYTLLSKYGIEHGLEVDQRHLDAFVKELEEAVNHASPLYTDKGGEAVMAQKPYIDGVEDYRTALHQFFNNQ